MRCRWRARATSAESAVIASRRRGLGHHRPRARQDRRAATVRPGRRLSEPVGIVSGQDVGRVVETPLLPADLDSLRATQERCCPNRTSVRATGGSTAGETCLQRSRRWQAAACAGRSSPVAYHPQRRFGILLESICRDLGTCSSALPYRDSVRLKRPRTTKIAFVRSLACSGSVQHRRSSSFCILCGALEGLRTDSSEALLLPESPIAYTSRRGMMTLYLAAGQERCGGERCRARLA
jgi:hypothetical protein